MTTTAEPRQLPATAGRALVWRRGTTGGFWALGFRHLFTLVRADGGDGWALTASPVLMDGDVASVDQRPEARTASKHRTTGVAMAHAQAVEHGQATDAAAA